ncbi:hypothetical protein N7468_008890 [Penicillium chermesinum]|uniref:Uncharacterized protein n=1 Tax=Penicillium chermesinum TaxID=63820 RepID=A0A9W9NGY2_9EURO|nr:uncharacterized protein N7468_008890 [Penicillium chermesinum]KAJ5219686.1 hypothetical protein N7468_008890 [Penicillium chermesinum]
MLYNGLQKKILSADLSDACDAAFNTTIDCPENLIQLVTYSIQNVGWNTSSLQSLCTPSCRSSLEDLATAVEASCNVPFYVNNVTMTFTEYMDFFQDKYELICLADEETDDFCLDVEASWNITNMVLLDKATWPTYTNKCYYDVSYGDWEWFYFENGTCLEPFDDYFQDATDANGLNQLAAWDYYVDRPPAINDDNYGWTEPLEWDEYPLEMQCSSCFLQKFKHGFESSWGEIWEYVQTYLLAR